MNPLRTPLTVIAALASLFLGHHAEAHGRHHLVRLAHVARVAQPVSTFTWGGGSDVVAEAARYIGSRNFTGIPGAWCAWGLSAWLRATGHAPLPNGMASSALSYGPHLSQPQRGAIVVMRGHVGLVENVRPDGLIGIISANWGGRVGRGTILRRQVVAFVGVP